MTAKQAIAEARRRWGKSASVERRFVKPYVIEKGALAGESRCSGHCAKDCPSFHWLCTVGRIELGMFFAVQGQGETFDAAFADVDARAAADRERYARLRTQHAAGASR